MLATQRSSIGIALDAASRGFRPHPRHRRFTASCAPRAGNALLILAYGRAVVWIGRNKLASRVDRHAVFLAAHMLPHARKTRDFSIGTHAVGFGSRIHDMAACDAQIGQS